MTDNQELNKIWFDLENARWTLSQAADLLLCRKAETLKHAEVTLYALRCVINRLSETRDAFDAVVGSMRADERRKALEEKDDE